MGIFLHILSYGCQIYQCQGCDYDDTDVIQGSEGEFVPDECEIVREFSQWADESEEGVDKDHYDSEFCRTHLRICQPEFLFQMCVDAYVDGHQKVHDQREQGYFKVDETGETYSDEDHHFVDAVDGVVDIISIYRPLRLADAGKGTVKRVAVPVYDKA